MPASIRARGVQLRLRPPHRARRHRPRGHSGHAPRRARAQRRGEVDPARRARGSAAPRAGLGRDDPARRDGGRAAPGAGAPGGRDRHGLPGPAHRCGRRAGRARRRDRGARGRRRRRRRPLRRRAGAMARPGRSRLRRACGRGRADPGPCGRVAARRRDADAVGRVRRPGSGSLRSCCRASTCCCSTSPPTTSTSTASPSSSSSCWSSPDRSSSSATTAPSSTASSPTSPSSTSTTTPITTFCRRVRGLPARARDVARRRAEEAYGEYEGQRSDLKARAQREREWSHRGVTKDRKNPQDNDRVGTWVPQGADRAARLAGPAQRAGAGAARRRGEAVGGVGAALHHRDGAASGCGGGPPRRCGRRAGCGSGSAR